MKKLHNGDRKIPTKLGDGMFMHSIFCHYKDVEWEVHNLNKSDVWKQLEVLYNGKYKLQYRDLPTGQFKNFRNVLYECAMDGMKIARPKYYKSLKRPEGRYVTFQSNSVDPTRELTEGLEGLSEGWEMVDVGNIPRDNQSVTNIMRLQEHAEFHIGADSGTLWTALAMKTPVKVLLNRRPDIMKHKEQDRAMLTLLRNHDNVEVRW